MTLEPAKKILIDLTLKGDSLYAELAEHWIDELIQKGITLEGIAKMWEIPVEDVKRLSRLK